jgi:hypothetical protein
MITDSIKCVAMVIVLLTGATGCAGLSGRACLQRQQRGNVFSVSGKVDPGGVTVHKVVYGTEGSQNNIKITWSGQRSPSGPRLRIYATRIECMDAGEVGNSGTFRRSSDEPGPPCATIGRIGGYSVEGEFVQGDLIIANGRGNPDILGSPAEYKLWVFGDPYKRALYTIVGSYFYGPDC